MKCQVIAGMALVTAVAAPLAFSDHFRDMVREPVEGRFQRTVTFRNIAHVSFRDEGTAEAAFGANETVRQDVEQKGEVRQRAVTYTEVQQKGGSIGEPGRAVVNATDALLHFYARQRDEAAELKAQAAKLASMHQEATAQALIRMATDHERLADRARDVLKDRFSTDVALAPPPAEPFVSDNASEMLQHDAQAHEQTISRLREASGDLRGAARDLLRDGLAGAQEHLTMIRQLRADGAAGTAVPGSVQFAESAPSDVAQKGEVSVEQKGVPSVRQKTETVVQQSVLQKAGPGIQQKAESRVEQKGTVEQKAVVEQKGVVQQKAEGKAEEKEKGGKPTAEQPFSVPPTETAQEVTIQPPPPPPAPPAPVAAAPPPPPPPAPVVEAPRPPRRRPAH